MRRKRINKRSKKYKENRKKKLDKRKELADEYGRKMTYWRYEGRKGIYWAVFSEWVRKRDHQKYGTCISCGKKFGVWNDAQAGHYAPAGNCGFALLFDPRNVNAECPACNNPVFSSGKLIPYRANLVKRYGERWVKKLDKDYAEQKVMKVWTQNEFDKEIRKLQRKIKKIDNENN